MRRFIAVFIMLTVFGLPVIASCVPSGYESENPNRPPDQQVPVEDEGNGGGAAVDESEGGGE